MNAHSRELFAHGAVALSRYVKALALDGKRPPEDLVAIAEFLADCARTRQDATDVGHAGTTAQGGFMTQYPVLTKPEAADALRCSVRAVERLIKAGSLKAVKVEGSTRIRRVDLDFYITGLGPNRFRQDVEEKAG